MTQLPLFTGHDLVTALARQTDVATSHTLMDKAAAIVSAAAFTF